MESLATVLRRIPVFASLPPGSFAKIIADLREERHARGAVICYEGDPARDFYIIKAGEVEVFVNQGADHRELVAVCGANQWFGERALFSDRERSATVIARSDVELWRLTKEKFDALIDENPWLIFHFTQVIGDRLYETNQQLSKVQAAFTAQMEALLAAQPPERGAFLLATAVLSSLDAAIVASLSGAADSAAMLDALAAERLFVTRRNGALAYPEAVRDFLLSRLAEEHGAAEVERLHARAGELYASAGRVEPAIAHYLAARCFEPAVQLIRQHAAAFLAGERLDLLRGWLARVPAAQAQALLAELPAQLQRLRLAPAAETAAVRGGAVRRLLGAGGGLAGVILGAAVWMTAPPAGLSVAGMRMLALLAWAVVCWALDVLPDYVVGIGLIVAWIVLGVVPPEVAVSGFTTTPFFLIIGVLGIAVSLQSSGLLFRLALQILRRFPLTYRGQALGLALSGTAITPGIPDVTSGVAVAAPIILALSDSLGYARRSRGSAGLAMAALLGFGQMSPFFLTGAAENLLAWGLLPEPLRAQISWGGWALSALPLALVTFACAFAVTMWYFPPEFQPTISRGLIETQIEALGRPSRAEWVNAAVLLAAIAGWISAPYHGVDPAWVAMAGMGVLLAANLLDRTSFRAGIYWDFLFYLGAVLSLTGVVQHLGVDRWLIQQLTPVLQPMAAQPGRFLLLLTLAIFAARFVLPSLPLVSLLTVTIVPIATAAGMHPVAVLLVICTAVAVWFLPYQSTYYLALYFGTKEKAFTHAQVRALAWTYGLIYLAAVGAAIPCWRVLGLLH